MSDRNYCDRTLKKTHLRLFLRLERITRVSDIAAGSGTVEQKATPTHHAGIISGRIFRKYLQGMNLCRIKIFPKNDMMDLGTQYFAETDVPRFFTINGYGKFYRGGCTI